MIKYIEINPAAVHSCLRVVIDDQLVGEWGAGYYIDDPRTGTFLLTSLNQWHQMAFAIEVKPNILESDPGPLDAKVS